ncbi:hypothetical protein ACQPW1_45655 [Nocardia sp. CA-128927]|uniref:hypothetical protein n=1 Tax=Nocardia sp. CA-128927 TaxID=3239975 RepID=UPI003D9837AD
MFALRGIAVAALIGAATLVGSGAAMADTIRLEPSTPAESVAKDCTGVIHPLAQLTCTLSSLSG